MGILQKSRKNAQKAHKYTKICKDYNLRRKANCNSSAMPDSVPVT